MELLGCVPSAGRGRQHGADKLIRGWQNETPLEAAQRMNHAAIVALLA